MLLGPEVASFFPYVCAVALAYGPRLPSSFPHMHFILYLLFISGVSGHWTGHVAPALSVCLATGPSPLLPGVSCDTPHHLGGRLCLAALEVLEGLPHRGPPLPYPWLHPTPLLAPASPLASPWPLFLWTTVGQACQPERGGELRPFFLLLFVSTSSPSNFLILDLQTFTSFFPSRSASALWFIAACV